jgi:Mrp family chromosome partitioning ATPase
VLSICRVLLQILPIALALFLIWIWDWDAVTALRCILFLCSVHEDLSNMAARDTQGSRIISLFNQSGGVGKSTLTMNLGYHLALRSHRVLLMDLDPQSSLTTFMGLEPLEIEKTLYDALLGDEPLPIQQDIHGVDLAPANINLSGAELELVTADMREQRMKDAIAPIQEQYDFILIDCPPKLLHFLKDSRAATLTPRQLLN